MPWSSNAQRPSRRPIWRANRIVGRTTHRSWSAFLPSSFAIRRRRDMRMKAVGSRYPMGYHEPMQLDATKQSEILKRLRRVEGQIRGIHAMIEGDRDCADVVTQFSAASRALEQASFKYFAAALAECAFDPDTAAANGYTPERLEKLFLRLA